MYKLHSSSARSALGVFLATALVSITAGCGTGSNSSSLLPVGGTTSSQSPTAKLSGNVHGGQQPVSGATIQLYEVGIGVGNAPYATGLAKPILSTAVTTGSTGNFSITGDYTCDAGSYVYITASGGNPGLSPSTTNNPQIALMAVLGSCSNLLASGANTYVNINEVTTVAAAYALAQFAGGTTYGAPLSSFGGFPGIVAPNDNFTTSSTNMQGVINAMAIAQVLANTSTGISPGNNTNGTATVEYWQINTIADMLAACVNTAGGTVGDGSACGTLFANVNIPSGTNPATGGAYAAPADTLQAALYMALNPSISSTNTANLFTLVTGTPPFQPTAATAATMYDFTIAVAYSPVVPSTTTAILTQPSVVALDSYGNAWVGNNSTVTPFPEFATELDPTGNPIPAGSASSTTFNINSYSVAGTTTGFLGNDSTTTPPTLQLAIDTNNKVWVPDFVNDGIMVITDSGPAYGTGTGFNSNGYATTLKNGGNANDSGGNGAIGYGLPAIVAGTKTTRPTTVAIDGNNDVFVSMSAGGTAPANGTSGTCKTGVANSALPADAGLYTFIGGSATNMSYSKGTGNAYATAIDSGTLDTTSGAAIPGSPFVWSFGYGSGGTNASTGSSPLNGILYQSYTGTGGTPANGATISAIGCNTPITAATATPYTLIGISSTLDTAANTQILGALGSGGANTTQVTVVPSIAGVGDAAAYMMSGPYYMTTDGLGNVWVSNVSVVDSTSPTPGTAGPGTSVKTSLVKIATNYGAAFTAASAESNWTYTLYHDMAGLSSTTPVSPRFMAADGNGAMWFTLSGGTSATIGAISASGTAISPTGGAVTGFNGSACPTTVAPCTFTGSATVYSRSHGAQHLAIDASGNVWLPMQGTSSTWVFTLVGAAGPVSTPLSLGLKNHLYDVAP